MKVDWVDYAFVTLIGAFTVVAPYTKVEESFNLQAVHDLLYHGFDLSKYDHFQFPGAVPRTFIGALALAGLAKPMQMFAGFESKLDMQLMVRGILGLANGWGIVLLRHKVEEYCDKLQTGKQLGYWYLFFQSVQFHVIYYSSRTLPNMLVFPLTNHALCQVLEENYDGALKLLSFSAVVFRAELAVLAGALALSLLLLKKLGTRSIMIDGLSGVIYGLALSAAIDSYFWQRFPMVPEVYGFIYNVVQGNSELWGVEPIHAYFTVHIPNMITNPVLLGIVPVGAFLDPSGRHSLRILGLASLLFVGIYSLQPHKEWRFVVYIMPVLALLAANGAIYSWQRRNKFWLFRILPAFLVLTTLASFGICVVKLGISSVNYPGGIALREFNALDDVQNTTQPLTVHLDISTCMTGASRFGELNPYITYDKSEDAATLEKVWTEFDYVITSQSNAASFPSVQGCQWDGILQVNAFRGLNEKFVMAQMKQAQNDPQRYIENLIWNFRRTRGIKSDLLDLWRQLVITEPHLFIYKRNCK